MGSHGELVLLSDQERSTWDKRDIQEGLNFICAKILGGIFQVFIQPESRWPRGWSVFVQVDNVTAGDLKRRYFTGPNRDRTIAPIYAIVHAKVGESAKAG